MGIGGKSGLHEARCPVKAGNGGFKAAGWKVPQKTNRREPETEQSVNGSW